MTRAEQRERIRTAYHEAGHAVIAYVLDLTPYRATIKPGINETGSYQGEVRTSLPEWVFIMPDSMARFMIHELAGIAAQDRYSRRGPFNSCQETDGAGDLRDFSKHWFELSTQTHGRCSDLDEFGSAAEGIVRHYWYAIHVFARVLLQRETIEHEELEQALAGAIASQEVERFPLFDYISSGLEPGTLPFDRYADLAAAGALYAQQLLTAAAA